MPVDYIGFAYAATVAAGGIIGYAKAGTRRPDDGGGGGPGPTRPPQIKRTTPCFLICRSPLTTERTERVGGTETPLGSVPGQIEQFEI